MTMKLYRKLQEVWSDVCVGCACQTLTLTILWNVAITHEVVKDTCCQFDVVYIVYLQPQLSNFAVHASMLW